MIDHYKVLYKEDDWVLLPREDYPNAASLSMKSLILHECQKHLSEGGGPWIFTIYTLAGLTQTCGHCFQHVPESLQTLFTLHNWDVV
jgi:hypothetical protein